MRSVWLAAAIGCSGGASDSDTDPPPSDVSRFDDPASFLCHPDLPDVDDVCDRPASSTVVQADGSSQIVMIEAEESPVDCFYVYPTASTDPMPNADFEPGDEEAFMGFGQASPYRRVCTVIAPVYRQVSQLGLFDADADFELAYADVLEAFQRTVARSDRPFLLLGHSQGSAHLTRLIAEVVEEDPALTERFVAAHLLGGFVAVPEGARVGGSFERVPTCASADEAGCVVHYASFASDDGPIASSPFGRSGVPGLDIACVSPPALLGNDRLDGLFPREVPSAALVLGGIVEGPYADDAVNDGLSTPFFSVPGLLSGACVERDGANFLEVTVLADPTDPRVDDVSGRAPILAGWGLHLVDFALASGDLVRLAERQIAAHASR